LILAKVLGEMTATINHDFYKGRKLLILDKLDVLNRTTGEQMVAIDSVEAGVGDTVLVLDEGTGARQIVGSTDAPLRSMIVGIVDRTDVP
jgi:microcompartment protein CcmK/EutM